MAARRSFLLSAGLAAAALAGADSNITEDWRLAVPQLGDGAPVAAVCPDGTLFLASRNAAVTAVDRQGRIVFLQRSTGFRAIDALACDSHNALYMAAGVPSTGESLVLLRRGPLGDQTAVVGFLGIGAFSMAAVGRNRLAVAGYGWRDDSPLHLLDTTGKPIRSFGESSPERNPVLARGVLLWHEEKGRLLFLPRKLAEIQIYDGEGSQIAVKGLGPLGPAAWPSEPDEPIDEIYGAAWVPRGALLIQGLTSRGVSLRFLDEDFHPVASEERNDLGRIAGSDSTGGLYFLYRNYVIRAHTRPLRGMPRGEPSVPVSTIARARS